MVRGEASSVTTCSHPCPTDHPFHTHPWRCPTLSSVPRSATATRTVTVTPAGPPRSARSRAWVAAWTVAPCRATVSYSSSSVPCAAPELEWCQGRVGCFQRGWVGSVQAAPQSVPSSDWLVATHCHQRPLRACSLPGGVTSRDSL